MASKRTSYDDDSTKNLHVPSTKRIKHHDDGKPEHQQHPLFPGLTLNGWVNPSPRRRLTLCFMNNLPQRNYTQSRIKAEGNKPLRVELRDAENHHIVRDEGSSMKIKICVLHGDFRKQDWTAEEFDKQIVIPREGKGSLLKGDTVISLKHGVAFINNVEFTDISKGRTKQVRLGAKIVRSNSIGSDIKEGRSEPFRVWHYRVKAYKKHNRPSMNDEVSRLRGIGGKRRDKLALHGIVSVKDFLQLYKTNKASLREKIGNIAEKSWKTIIAHVKECDVDDDEEEERVKQHAYKNLNDPKQMPIDTTTNGLVETSTGLQTAQYGGQDQILEQLDFAIPPQGQYTDPTSFNQSFAYQPEMWPSTSISQSDIGSEFYNQMLPMGEMPPYNFSEAYNFDGASQITQFGSYSLEQVNANPLPFVYVDAAGPSNHSSSHNFAVHVSSNLKPKKDWQKIRSAVKWFMLYVTKRDEFWFICTP
ncbi:calmodulin-binding protein 60 C-like isoform X2 [Trifolium pratense]|uniref:calmodulin-binding protein 60 C-like isoform X2 n=1 Tax=Trifolium pratense TaxID=57577 RepID=UPI001E6922CD|nr:calmodulin-binding protein 60 C-like isoform X2 [Trifolium pratense]